MKKVFQTRTNISDNSKPMGNCFQACIASVLNLPIKKVPDEAKTWRKELSREESWAIYWNGIQSWLKDRKYLFLEFSGKGLLEFNRNSLNGLTVIITGPSPRNAAIDHCVVGHLEAVIDKNGRIIDIKSVIDHDPHPNGDGLLPENVRKWAYGILVRYR